MTLSDFSNGKVVIKLDKNNYKQFLMQAKEEGFKWSLSKEIQDVDECTHLVLLDLDLKIISNLSSMRYENSKELQDLQFCEYSENENKLIL